MKKMWQEPKLEVLNVSSTMGGPGLLIPDAFCTSNEPGHPLDVTQSPQTCWAPQGS